MYVGFNMGLESVPFVDEKNYAEKYDNFISSRKAEIRNCLDDYIGPTGVIQSKKLTDDWFKEVSVNVFLSHSHKDVILAKAFGYWLYENFGIVTFIDSCVWGYADDLLREIDNEYCWMSEGSYNYSQRNQSTAHVHMMLAGALYKMINRTECLIFLNTPNSITVGDVVSGNQTASPWIYSELLCSELIKHRSLGEHRAELKQGMFNVDESINISYDVSTSHLYDLTRDMVDKWYATYRSMNAYNSLNALYRIAGLPGVVGING